jgi:hypothetical protein
MSREKCFDSGGRRRQQQQQQTWYGYRPLSFLVDVLLGCVTGSLPSGAKVFNCHQRDFRMGAGDSTSYLSHELLTMIRMVRVRASWMIFISRSYPHFLYPHSKIPSTMIVFIILQLERHSFALQVFLKKLTPKALLHWQCHKQITNKTRHDLAKEITVYFFWTQRF